MLIIDRFEEEWAVIEHDGRGTFNLPRSLLPEEAREGDVLCLELRIDKQATEQRRREIEELTRELFRDE